MGGVVKVCSFCLLFFPLIFSIFFPPTYQTGWLMTLIGDLLQIAASSKTGIFPRLGGRRVKGGRGEMIQC